MGKIAQLAEMTPKNDPAAPMQALVTLSLHKIAGCLAELTRLMGSPRGRSPSTEMSAVHPDSEPNAHPTDFREPAPLERIQQLEEALRNIVCDGLRPRGEPMRRVSRGR